MPSQVLSSVENNFTKGLITEFTGLNFPENAATDTSNCIYTIVGDVTRREGIDKELNAILASVSRTNKAVSSYKWDNAGGDGLTQVVVVQVGSTLYFYKSSAATIASPLSAQKLASTVDISGFVASGATFDPTLECQFSDGNGYLFVYRSDCDPLFCSYNAGVITGNSITINIRDFVGVSEPTLAVNTRPLSLTNEHLYNLTNQGWTQGNAWTAQSSNTTFVRTGSQTYVVASGLGVSLGDFVNLSTVTTLFPGGVPPVPAGTVIMSGSVTAYSGSSLTINIISATSVFGVNQPTGPVNIVPINHGYINTWLAAEGNFPSNADVWWYFKDTTDAFNPAVMQPNVSLNTGTAPQGHFVLNAFSQTRSLTSGISGLTDVVTNLRPKTGTWFQGRVWYTGVDAQQVASGDADNYSWTENIYFSQIVTTSSDFGNCYQTNDPTSENLFSLLPTDGGIIKIQGCGSIYKLFPLMNALLVFAANGVWYVSGNQGIGFTANDYSIVKLSAVKSISSTSFVDINGMPMFWNEEGIYSVEPAKQGQGLLNSPLHVNPLEVTPLTVGTILTFYNSIPIASKKYARGAYNPIDYTVQWFYKSTNETNVTDRYTYDSVLCLNTFNKAFYPYSLTINGGNPSLNSIVYVSSPGGSTAPNSVFKYLVSDNSGNITFAEELDGNFVDWATLGTPVNYISYFITGYKLHGQAQRRFQVPYIYVFNKLNGASVGYKIQGIWDYATSGNSGRYSVAQITTISKPNFGMAFRRHRLRGQGLTLQIKVISTDGMPFDIMGWSTFETQNMGV